MSKLDQQLAKDISQFYDDPLGFVMYSFAWSEGQLEQYTEPRKWQKEYLNDLGKKIRERGFDGVNAVEPIRKAIASGHGIGKLNCYNMELATPRGLTTWGELKQGDYVFGADGKPTKITNTKHYSGVPIYRVKFDDGSYTDVSSGHLWNVRGRQERRKKLDTWRTLETIELLELGVKRSNGKSEARQWEIPIQEPAEFEKRQVKIHPYLMGVWLGDGSKLKPEYTKPHKEVADKVRSFGYDVVDRTDGKTKYITGQSKNFMHYDVFNCGSHERYIPDDYKYNTIENRLELFKGLCDTDGEVHKSGSIGYSTTSKRLADDVIWLSRSLGCKSMLHKTVKKPFYYKDNEKVHCKDCYRITINAPFNPFSIKHRKENFKVSEPRYLKRWIDSIEYVRQDDGMCIEVDNKDGLYLANDFIVTHNSALTAWIILWTMSTRPHCKGIVTSNTSDQLKTKTWSELGKWLKLSINEHWFEYSSGKGSMCIKHKKHPETWRVDAQTCREENSESFAGLHAANSTPFYIFDEASAIPDKIFEVAYGGLTDGEPMMLLFGNPTRNSGKFRECWRRDRHRWETQQIDSRTVDGTNKALLSEWIEDYGEDSDFVKVRVRGEFPNMSIMQFISNNDIDNAINRHLTPNQYKFAPVIIGCDPAWTGNDELVIYMRQGLYSKILSVIEKNDNDFEIAQHLCTLQDKYKADAVNIDAGYGTGIISAGRTLGRSNWNLVWFSGKALDKGCFNKRAEIIRDTRDWLKQGGSIEDDKGLIEELRSIETVPRADGKIQIESKDKIKKRIGISTNKLDALALTFSVNVMPKGATGNNVEVVSEFEPYD